MKQDQYERMTTKPIGRLLLSLSIPTIISMMVTNIYNIVDTAFVGTLGTSESGATGIVFSFMAILQAIAFMCGQGAGSIMSRRLGAKKIDEAIRFSSTGFFLSFGLGLLIAIVGMIFIDPLLILMGSTKTIAPYARIYIFYILLSAPFFTSSFTMNNLLRYEGKARLGTIGMMTGAVLNIVGDMLLIFGFKLGIAGAGISTAISQFVSFCILISMFLFGKTQTRISLKYISVCLSDYWEIVATGFPSLLRQGLNSLSTMMLNHYSGLYGDAAVSAMSIAARVSFFSMAIAIGIGQGFQPISSYNYGAGKKGRVREAFWKAFIASEIVIIIVAIPIFIYAGDLVRLLRDDDQVVIYGIRALRLLCLGQAFIPFTMMVEMGFQSTGAKLYATISSSLRSGLILIPTLMILAKVRALEGVQEAQPISFVLTFFICGFLCRLFLDRLKE